MILRRQSRASCIEPSNQPARGTDRSFVDATQRSTLHPWWSCMEGCATGRLRSLSAWRRVLEVGKWLELDYSDAKNSSNAGSRVPYQCSASQGPCTGLHSSSLFIVPGYRLEVRRKKPDDETSAPVDTCAALQAPAACPVPTYSPFQEIET